MENEPTSGGRITGRTINEAMIQTMFEEFIKNAILTTDCALDMRRLYGLMGKTMADIAYEMDPDGTRDNWQGCLDPFIEGYAFRIGNRLGGESRRDQLEKEAP